MYPGETNEIIADPELAYGDVGLPPHLPPKGQVL
jgi:FKBP-type peptidyl-prolyl cis-trans isomerase